MIKDYVMEEGSEYIHVYSPRLTTWLGLVGCGAAVMLEAGAGLVYEVNSMFHGVVAPGLHEAATGLVANLVVLGFWAGAVTFFGCAVSYRIGDIVAEWRSDNEERPAISQVPSDQVIV